MKYSEENIFALMERIGMHAGHPVSQHETHRQVKIEDTVWPNLCFDLKLDPQRIELQVTMLKQQIHNGSVPSVLMFKPNLISAEMSRILKSHASGHAHWAAMTMHLQDWNYKSRPATFSIHRISSDEDMKTWRQITNESLMGGSDINTDLFLKLKNDKDFAFFLADFNGQPAAGCMSFQSNEKAGLYLISTRKEFRGNGLGTAITAAAVEYLKTKGVQEIHLQATAIGEPVYASLGFVRHGNVEVFNLK